MTIDELGEFGMERMDEAAIEEFLTSHGFGVLALPTDGAPYVVPMSFGYDGGTTLYFTYVVGEESQKADLTEAAEAATFLAYSAESAFSWRSVVLTGTVTEVPQNEWARHAEMMDDNAWHPDIFERAMETERIRIYRFDVDDWSGIRHTGLPSGFEGESSDATAD
ncbi:MULTISPECIES: pyridoxamine 5'-phosphate oxidase family protein [Salinibaculum]|uniref:pyridoxamine 5'-phosphate oxidase family protein n=1 Tax=Salinibaculum TaxID=2732368 RepID=UPI0030CB1C78